MNIVIFGAPGSGKGTQSKKLIEKYNLYHISTGDILRQEITDQTELGLQAQDIIDHGNLMPDDVMIEMIQHILSTSEHKNGFLFDGFPRTINQAIELDHILKAKNQDILCSISLDVPQTELIRRILERAQSSGRKDDTEIVIQKRLQEYKNKTTLVANYYHEQHKLYPIHGENHVDIVFEKIVSIIDSL